MFDDTMDIYGAYTNRSFWQVYYTDESSPFRETNHEPEIWAQFHPGWELWGFTNTWNSFGVVHQSNGRGGTLFRSWNRVYAWLTVERGNFAMSFKPWYRIPEEEPAVFLSSPCFPLLRKTEQQFCLLSRFLFSQPLCSRIQ